MRKALELQPEQPHVLNYLGYSWIDQGINLDEGMKMIKRAVDQRPDDGYIVDFARLGLLPHRQFRGRGEESRARHRSQARRSDHQRPSRRRLLARRPHAGSQIPVGACPRPQAGAGRACRRSRPRSRTVCRRTPPPRLPPTRKKKTARAADRRIWGCRRCRR